MRRLLALCLLASSASTIAHAQLNSAAPCLLPKVNNGTVTKAPAGNQYRLTCNQGFAVTGNATAMCSKTAAGEHWSQTLGSCMAVCTAPPVGNGTVVYASGEPATVNIMTNTNVSVKCNPGSTLMGYGTNYCGISAAGGTWRQPFGACSASCAVSPVQNAKVLDASGKPATGNLAPNTSYTVQCNAGYTPPPNAVTHGTCNYAGVLSAQPSSCAQKTVVACPATMQIKHADFAANNTGTLNYTPADWKLTAGAALSLTLQLSSAVVEHGEVLDCGYSSANGLASLIKHVSDFGYRCDANPDGKSFSCYR